VAGNVLVATWNGVYGVFGMLRLGLFSFAGLRFRKREDESNRKKENPSVKEYQIIFSPKYIMTYHISAISVCLFLIPPPPPTLLSTDARRTSWVILHMFVKALGHMFAKLSRPCCGIFHLVEALISCKVQSSSRWGIVGGNFFAKLLFCRRIHVRAVTRENWAVAP
jgi:hypothetical protein